MTRAEVAGLLRVGDRTLVEGGCRGGGHRRRGDVPCLVEAQSHR
jgi:hypothetical protein